jgi:phage-related protein (TIGR01555 family)
VHVLKGIAAPSFVRPRLRGWGFSVVEALVRSINQYLKATDLTFNILDEFKIDYFKIEGLAATLTQTGGTEKIQKRMQLVNQQKNYQRAVVMDSKDDFIQKQLSFGGISETMIGIRMQVASDLRMPLTKVFGISAEGFSSGEDDIENYNAMVESTVRQKSKYGLIEIIKLRCQQKFGYVPDDITIKFKPLRILGAEQEENVKTQKFARLLQNCQAGLMSVKEYKDAVNKENLLGVQLDTSLDKIETGTTGDTEVKAAPKAPESTTTAPDAKE